MTGKEKLGLINLSIIVVVVIAIIAFKCSGSNSANSSGEKSNSDYLLDCQKMIQREAVNPDSVNLKTYSSSVKKAPSGNTAVILSFSAKNALGAEIEHSAFCIFSTDGSAEIRIK